MPSALMPFSVCLPSVESNRQVLTAKSSSLGSPDMSDLSILEYSVGRLNSFGRPNISRVESDRKENNLVESNTEQTTQMHTKLK